MKRKLLILSVLAICIASLAAGTIAFFTSEDKAHNVITTGSVEITVQEWADEAKRVPFVDLEGVLPGASVTKIAEVKNTGASEAWIRVQVEKSMQLGNEFLPDSEVIGLNLNTEDWTLGEDGYLYYNEALKPGEVTAPIFTTVTFSKKMGNEYRDVKVNVDVAAEAVQTANNGTSAMDAQGWPRS